MTVQKHKATDEVVSLSVSAKGHILNYLAKEPKAVGVRFSAKKTGCSGWSYVVDYVSVAEVDDLCFTLSEKHQLYIDKKSYPLLKGMFVDFVKQGLNAKFVFNNPNQKGQCGCGESFTVDEA